MRGVMRIFRLSGIGYIILFCITLSIEVSSQSSVSLCQPFGTVKYKDRIVPDGCKVMAYIGGEQYADAVVSNGEYTLSIPADNPSTPGKDGWEDGEFITLKVKDYSGSTLFKASSGNTRVDINLNTMGVLNLTTWGKIKALFK